MKPIVAARITAAFLLLILLGSCAEPGGYQAGVGHAASATSYAQPPPARPGLGTRWGEGRKSVAWEIRFVRANPNEPLAIARILYND